RRRHTICYRDWSSDVCSSDLEHDSPKSVLKELKYVLDATCSGIPTWMAEARAELALLSGRFEERASAVLNRLNELAGRVEAALRSEERRVGEGGRCRWTWG